MLLFKKMLRDMSKHKLQFIAIFLMTFFAVYIFVGIGSEAYGIEDNLNSYYNDTNMANVWIYNDTISNSTVNQIENLSSTLGVERQLTVDTVGDMKDNPDIKLHFIENNTISKYYPVKGPNIDINDKDGIWLDKRFADARNLSIGDKIKVKFNNIEIEKTVRGLGYSPEYIFEQPKKTFIPDFNIQGFGYLSYKSIPGDNINYNTLLIRTNENTSQYQKDLDTVSNNYSIYLTREGQGSHKTISSEIDQHKMMGVMIPIIFVIVSLLTLLTTMTRIVSNQRTQIGILKSLGFKNRTIINHYLSYGIFMIIFGSVLGFILGPLTLPGIFEVSMATTYTFPVWSPGFDWSFVLVPLVMLILAILFTYITVKSIAHESPASTLMPKAPKISKLKFINNTKFWKNLNFNIKWNIKDMSRSKIRTLVTIVVIITCTILVLTSLGMENAMDEIEVWEYNDINHYNNQINLESNITDSQIDYLSKEYNGTQVMSQEIEIKHNGVSKTSNLNSFNNTGIITPNNKYMKKILFDNNSVLVSEKTAQILNLKVGDTVEWHIYSNNKWVNSTITGIYADSSSQGLIISPDKINESGLNFTPTSIVTYNKSVDDNISGVASVSSVSDLQKTWKTLMETVNEMVDILIIFSILLSIVVLYSLAVLSFTESERDLATLKVIGFKSRYISRIYLNKSIFLAIIGFIIGIPLAYQVLGLILDSSGEDYYFPNSYSISSIIMTFIIVVGVSVLVNIIFSRKIKNIDMVQSLKKGRE
ncbi:hypothetical protein BGI41_07140 [Methanobrevibacter sp. 87.7]|uniref:ABC transporter permease n=1 Tax=Methanobrevibacter sp. 87.7 TaxID=387957 RepID=UPI000B50BA3C|nr:FtsX-like permease family protein [Methanobrevibacter sp. 87.7]OWT32541.1 hypothetical protein BGI41_07140 [Methanobrevibacter sp. 87.7]